MHSNTFLSRDPIPAQMQPYAFVRNQPIDLVDPLGLCPIPQPGELVFIVSLRVHDDYPSELAAEMILTVRVAKRILSDPCCPKVSFVQVVRERYDGSTKYYPWVLDGRPWYPNSDYNPPSGTLAGSMRDGPGWDPLGFNSSRQFEHQFETCLVCVNPSGKIGCVLGCVTWSYDYTTNPKPPPDHLVTLRVGGQTIGPTPPIPAANGNDAGPGFDQIKPPPQPPSSTWLDVTKKYREGI